MQARSVFTIQYAARTARIAEFIAPTGCARACTRYGMASVQQIKAKNSLTQKILKSQYFPYANLQRRVAASTFFAASTCRIETAGRANAVLTKFTRKTAWTFAFARIEIANGIVFAFTRAVAVRAVKTFHALHLALTSLKACERAESSAMSRR